MHAGDALAARLTGFATFLRVNGFGIGTAHAADLLTVADRIGIFDRRAMQWSLKSLLCSRAEEWRRFDELFDAYFLAPNRQAAVESRTGGAGLLNRDLGGGLHDASEGLPIAPEGNGNPTTSGSTAQHGAHGEDSTEQADFRHLVQPDQVREMERLMRRFASRLRHLETRREKRNRCGRRLDLPTTIRRSVARGGVPLDLAWCRKRRVRPRLVLLLDVSRSMSLYSFFYLRLARALSGALTDVHCFIFHTRLTAVSQALRDPDPWRAQERLQVLSAGWAGGTRIGECLDAFHRDYAAALLHSRTAVLIASDGYETGDTQLLEDGLIRLRRRTRRIIWLNPLTGRPGFTPDSHGMRAALPHVDMVAPGASLADIERVLPQLLHSIR